MQRRDFVKETSLGIFALSCSLELIFSSCTKTAGEEENFHQLCGNLLQDWCDGMIRMQIIAPDQPELHGSLDCPACEHIHGRCMDAVYPFLFMADNTGEEKYLDAAKLVMEWAENNVSQSDGSWTVIPDPGSWKGITVFGAIALAEALHYHGHILEKKLKQEWTERLAMAAEYVYQKFDLTFTNINYGATAIYGLYLFGKILNRQKYIERSFELANGIGSFFTAPNCFLFGEGKPGDKLSAKGLPAIDLGYNVEESLSNLVLYAVETNNTDLIKLLKRSLDTHLKFMLPDGGWDNSWGTRQFKWSYWGSRTCDGSQLTYACLSKFNPAYSTAVIRNTTLLKSCTSDGLLHGGPHYLTHGIKPCIHHTFEHAKPLATLLNNWDKLKDLSIKEALPREKEDGAEYFPEIDTALLAQGNWLATVSAYDAIYDKGKYRQASGGALSLLFNKKAGLILTASMAKYALAEKNNQQANPGEDFALTPRIETFADDVWYTNLYDLSAQIKAGKNDGVAFCKALVGLKNEAFESAIGTASEFELDYRFYDDKVLITAETKQEIKLPTKLVLPFICSSHEKVERVSQHEIVIHKPGGTLHVRADESLAFKLPENERVFNMVPGVEALPVLIPFSAEHPRLVQCTISME